MDKRAYNVIIRFGNLPYLNRTWGSVLFKNQIKGETI